MRSKLFSYSIIVSIAVLFSCNGGLVGPCEKTREWSIQNYRIIEHRCPDLVSAPYFNYDVYSDDRLVGSASSKRNDTCIFNFQATNESYLTFNVCSDSIQELKAQKNLLDKDIIDSVSIITREPGERQLLSGDKAQNFVRDWNTSRARNYSDEPFDSSFSAYPAYQYKLTVFYKGNQRHFYGYNYLVVDSSGWVYEMSNGEDQDYFHKYWRK